MSGGSWVTDVWRANRLDDLSWTAVARSAQNKCPSQSCRETRSFREWSRHLQRYITSNQQRMTVCFLPNPPQPCRRFHPGIGYICPSAREHGCSLVSWCARCIFIRQLVILFYFIFFFVFMSNGHYTSIYDQMEKIRYKESTGFMFLVPHWT